MANDARYGLRPVRMLNGDSDIPTHEYIISASDSALYIGDPVIHTGTSNTTVFERRRIGSLQEVTKATAGTANLVLGAIVGFVPKLGIDETVLHNPASTARICIVADHPDTVFRIQSEGTVAATDVGSNTNLIFTHGGSTATGLSGVEADDTIGTTAAHQLRILAVAEQMDESEANTVGTNADYLVKINNHQRANITAGV